MILTIMASVAEFESRRIGERIRAAMAAKVARGGRHNRRPAAFWRRLQAASRAARRRAAGDYHAEVGPVIRRLRAGGLTLGQIAGHLNAVGHRTRTGGEWTWPNVSRVLVRAGRSAGVVESHSAGQPRGQTVRLR